MNAIKHLGCSVSKGIVTVQIECKSPQAAKLLFNAITAAEKAGMLHFDPVAHEASPLTSLIQQESSS